MPGALGVSLGSQRVGTITNLSGDYNLFSFDEEYLEDERRPVLSQAYIGTGGGAIRIVPRTHRIAPPFFANLLPEEGSLLRSLVARRHRINRTRDFPYLEILGRDLPGAVVIDELGEPGPDASAREETLAPAERPLRFSLAGVQLKFSASMVGDRLAIPIDGIGGSWIAKLPTNTFPRLPENEHTIMSFARAIGLPVPETGLVDLDSIEGLPADLPALRADEPRKAYIIKRFDRHENGGRTHVEDFNQIANQQPDEKYDTKSSSWLANVIATICPQPDVDDFVKRLVFGICIGNNDMHLKNWAVSYPDSRNARIAGLYDYVCTREYYPNGALALTVGGERDFARIGRDALQAFAKGAEISARRTAVLAREVVAAIRDTWPSFKSGIENAGLASAIERGFTTVPLMNERGR
jgi:serine/threonine-protein kinase HipA